MNKRKKKKSPRKERPVNRFWPKSYTIIFVNYEPRTKFNNRPQKANQKKKMKHEKHLLSKHVKSEFKSLILLV